MTLRDFGELLCTDGSSPVWGLFQFSVAPPLLYYSYIPVIVASLLIAAYVFPRRRESLRGRPLLLMLGFFVLWVLNILVQWVAARHDHIMFGWQLTALLEAGLYLSAANFAYVFMVREELPRLGQWMLIGAGLLVAALTPTSLNIAAYDVINCEGVTGPLWSVLYPLEAILILAILVFGVYRTMYEKDLLVKEQNGVFSASLVFCLAVFFFSNYYGELTGVYEFNLWGPLGMAVFFVVLGYIIVKFHAFHTKAIATEALVWGLLLLVGSQFFYVTSLTTLILDVVTFVAAAAIGYLQIKMVRREIAQREEMAVLLQQQQSLEHLVTHKVKSAFTRIKFIFAEVLEGTFGKVPVKVRDIADQGLVFTNDGIDSVDQVLNAANLKSGKIKYEMKPVDFKAIVLEAVEQKRGPAEKKGLQLSALIDDKDYVLTGDAFWLKEVAYNFIDNAVKYTPSGSIVVGITKTTEHLTYWVKDTGLGINEEDMKVMFTEGGRGKESVKVNADSTGYGLYTIKLVVEGHGGRVWITSEVGKGSTFFAQLPLAGSAINEKTSG